MKFMMKRIWRIRTCLSKWINGNPVPGRSNDGRRKLSHGNIFMYSLCYLVGVILLAAVGRSL